MKLLEGLGKPGIRASVLFNTSSCRMRCNCMAAFTSATEVNRNYAQE